MDMKSHRAARGLPEEGQNIEFVLDGRDVALAGTFVRQVFRSHWSEYDMSRVRNWWSAESEGAHVPPRQAQGRRAR